MSTKTEEERERYSKKIEELGDASVPFPFDVHAMIFSENAPELENKFHKEFKDKSVNLVNLKREFFEVTLEEVLEICKIKFRRIQTN